MINQKGNNAYEVNDHQFQKDADNLTKYLKEEKC